MNRRKFVRSGLISSVALASVRALAEDKAKGTEAVPAPQSFELDELTIDDLQKGMGAGKYTAQTLAQKYLERIEEIDKRGHTIKSVIETNPEALAIATALDTERKAGRVRGRLHGIPVLIKDNIDTHDRMMTTAGSLALAGSIPLQDSSVAKKAARRRRGDHRQDELERMGELSFQPFQQWLERARRPDQESLRP